ncbi:hypothetical protein AMAG_09904 [Allomyces macrogynus ATCC 38327]|uniref:Uncharacterized protein n=1 Tax=Allomyces macrogynus (strain ATCC 38327) TaxID=578462 RepID=A0A0L0SPT6_ALLM3|nr:hypothetical protein AMAG_09904 [Allomyces macrogynus ATCC 38327]|eukprot:KNE64543.1 hypothetical protein AMAG_09904 [Allomyces macrogynus ATCC 38327]
MRWRFDAGPSPAGAAVGDARRRRSRDDHGQRNSVLPHGAWCDGRPREPRRTRRRSSSGHGPIWTRSWLKLMRPQRLPRPLPSPRNRSTGSRSTPMATRVPSTNPRGVCSCRASTLTSTSARVHSAASRHGRVCGPVSTPPPSSSLGPGRPFPSRPPL